MRAAVMLGLAAAVVVLVPVPVIAAGLATVVAVQAGAIVRSVRRGWSW